MILSLMLAAVDSAHKVDLSFVELGWMKMIVLGIVQGITELLPISSTAHMRIVPALLGWKDPGTAFSAAMQLASLGAVVAYFWNDIKSLMGGTIRAVSDGNYQAQPFRITSGLVIGTIPLIIFGLAFKKMLDAPGSPFRTLTVIGIASIVMSLLLALSERQGGRERNFEKLTLKDGIIVGLAQACALIPGVSRSGSTLTAGLFLGMERETAAKFSFLLGLPAVLLAGAVELHTLFKAGLDFNGWVTLMVGLVSASIAAFFAIFGLLRYLENQSTWIFVWYRLIMGMFLLVSVATNFLPN